MGGGRCPLLSGGSPKALAPDRREADNASLDRKLGAADRPADRRKFSRLDRVPSQGHV